MGWKMVGGFVALLALAAGPAAAVLVHDRTEVFIPMGDVHPETGEPVALAADRYLPQTGAGPWPVILIQTPYFKDRMYFDILQTRSEDPLYQTPDYAFVIMDWRGFGVSGSEGMAYAGSPTRGRDGYAAVEWAAAQPWCTGAVGTWGASAVGKVQFETAAERPPSLRACVPIVATFREWYDVAYPGGVYGRNRTEFVGGYFGAGLVREFPMYTRAWEVIESTSGDPARIDVPMLHISGWYDHQPAQSLREFEAIQATGGPGAAGRQKALIGPWSHGGIGAPLQHEIEYAAAAYESSAEALRFFDFYLRGIDNGWELRAPLRFFQMNEEKWVDAEAWASEGYGGEQTFFLHADGTLAEEPPSSPNAALQYTADPNDPVPTIAGALLASDFGEQGPADLAELGERGDVLLFQTPPLEQPLAIAGNAQARFSIMCSAVDTDLAPRLVQIYPDGRWMLLGESARRASLRHGFTAKELLEPGVVYDVPVEFPPLAATIPAGHRLGLMLAPSNYDRFDVNPQDGSDFSDEEGAVLTPATVTVLLNAVNGASLMVPLLEERRPAREGWMVF